MKTLYDLLGALPDDDADSLRSAFRRAAKNHHPDNNPDDSDAALRFRRILRAHDILGDRRQRATYDELLEIALQAGSSASGPSHAIGRPRKFILDLAWGAAVSATAIGSYLLIGHVLKAPVIPAPLLGPNAVQGRAILAATSARLSDRLAAARAHHHPTPVETVRAPEQPDEPKDEIVVSSASPENREEVAPGPGATAAGPEAETGDANSYRERGILAYHNGDLRQALDDFSAAIRLDPRFSDAYVDRGIVFHRMGDLKRALDDVAQAKRIDDANVGGVTARKPRP